MFIILSSFIIKNGRGGNRTLVFRAGAECSAFELRILQKTKRICILNVFGLDFCIVLAKR